MANFGLILIGLAGALLAGTTAYFLFRRGPNDAEMERRRRMALLAAGRITGGQIDDVRGAVLCFSYEVGGVGYAAAQDLSMFPDLRETLPAAAGSVIVRYDRAHPGNSIVHCESWSGLPRTASNHSVNERPQPREHGVSGAA